MIASFVLGLVAGFLLRLKPTFLADIVSGVLPDQFELKTEERHTLNFILVFFIMIIFALIFRVDLHSFSALVGIGLGYFGQCIYTLLTQKSLDEEEDEE